MTHLVLKESKKQLETLYKETPAGNKLLSRVRAMGWNLLLLLGNWVKSSCLRLAPHTPNPWPLGKSP